MGDEGVGVGRKGGGMWERRGWEVREKKVVSKEKTYEIGGCEMGERGGGEC